MLRGRAGRLRPGRAGISRQYTDPRDPPVRPHRRVRRDHRFRASLPSARPHVLPDDAGPAGQADGRQPPHPRASPARESLWPLSRGDHLRLEPHPVRGDRSGAAADDGRVRDRAGGGEFLLSRGRRHAAAGTGRDRAGGRRGGGAPLPRGDRHVLAGMGRLARHPVRMARRGDPRRHHPGAQRLRRHRGDRRGDDDVDSRGAGQPPQLGLPLLLAARRLLRGQRAQPPRRHAHHGALPRLHRQCRRRHGQRASSARVRPQRALRR